MLQIVNQVLKVIKSIKFKTYTLFYKNNFIRTKALILAKKLRKGKNKDTLAVPQSIRTKCLGQPFLK